MRSSILAIIVAFGTTIVVPALAQQQTGPSQQEEADKGIKTRNSGESGYVSEQEKQPDNDGYQQWDPGLRNRRRCEGARTRTKAGLCDGYDQWDEQRPRFG